MNGFFFFSGAHMIFCNLFFGGAEFMPKFKVLEVFVTSGDTPQPTSNLRAYNEFEVASVARLVSKWMNGDH